MFYFKNFGDIKLKGSAILGNLGKVEDETVISSNSIAETKPRGINESRIKN